MRSIEVPQPYPGSIMLRFQQGDLMYTNRPADFRCHCGPIGIINHQPRPHIPPFHDASPNSQSSPQSTETKYLRHYHHRPSTLERCVTLARTAPILGFGEYSLPGEPCLSPTRRPPMT